MYYNSSGPGQSHYNYVAVQGAGAPTDAAYRCASKAYDQFNAARMYGDHAIGGLGSYSEVDGRNQQAGTVNFADETEFGKRDMCDRPVTRFYPMRHEVRDYRTFLIIALAAALLYGFYTGRLNLAERRTQILLAVLAAAIIFFFH